MGRSIFYAAHFYAAHPECLGLGFLLSTEGGCFAKRRIFITF